MWKRTIRRSPSISGTKWTFPEKRPFFLENAGTFQTPETLFFSRRIISPRWGTRVTGKAGRWMVGSLVAEDRLPNDDGTAEDALVGVLRLQREMGRESTVGALVTTRDAGVSRNHVASADARIRMGPHWTLQGQAARSVDQGIAAETTKRKRSGRRIDQGRPASHIREPIPRAQPRLYHAARIYPSHGYPPGVPTDQLPLASDINETAGLRSRPCQLRDLGLCRASARPRAQSALRI